MVLRKFSRRISWKMVITSAVVVCGLGGGATAWAASGTGTTGPSSPGAWVTPDGGYPPGIVQQFQQEGKPLPTFSSGSGDTVQPQPSPPATLPPLPGNSGATGDTKTTALSGIVDQQQAPFSSGDFAVANEYFGAYQGASIIIYAGEKMSEGGGTAVAGGLRIDFGGDGNVQQFLEPSYVGMLTITAVNGSSVSLTRQDGSTVTFSLDNQAFSS